MALNGEVPSAADAVFGASNVAVTIKSYLGSPVKGPVTDWRLELDGTWSAPVPWVKFGGDRLAHCFVS